MYKVIRIHNYYELSIFGSKEDYLFYISNLTTNRIVVSKEDFDKLEDAIHSSYNTFFEILCELIPNFNYGKDYNNFYIEPLQNNIQLV